MAPATSLPVIAAAAPRRRLPEWLKRPLPPGDAMMRTRRLLDGLALNTVCVEARCPNLTECWTRGTATFMILGDRCTRRCGFCAVSTQKPEPPEADEPQRMADAAAQLGLRHLVITSVARDDLPDEGAGHFADCIAAVRERLPQATVEVLVPDFHGRPELIGTVVAARPEVYNHNLETVARLQKRVRPAARYERSLEVLRTAKALGKGQGPSGSTPASSPGSSPASSPPKVRHSSNPSRVGRAYSPPEDCGTGFQPVSSQPGPPGLLTKSGLMVGLGETRDELLVALRDLRSAGCDLLTIGQYLRPGPSYLPVERYYPPAEFDELAAAARELGFSAVASGPFVRSSYFAETLFAETDMLRRRD
jgi:lipoic acid synthetase